MELLDSSSNHLDDAVLSESVALLKGLQVGQPVQACDRPILGRLTNWLSQADSVCGQEAAQLQGTAREYYISWSNSFSRARPSRATGELVGESPRVGSCSTRRIACEDPELQDELCRLTDWEAFNIFRVAELSKGRPLETVTLALLEHFDLIDKLKLPFDRLKAFLRDVEGAYNPNPYHNSMHAADVTQSLGVMLANEELRHNLTDLEMLAMILATAVHDTGHSGVSNDYLVRTNSDMALRYNDASVNENMHLAVAFGILKRRNNDVLAPLSEEQFRFVRRLMIQIVLATDMAGHTDLLKDFTTAAKLLGPNFAQWQDEKRSLAMRMLVHCADIGNPAKPLPLSRQWTSRIIQESFEQGDRERKQGLSVSLLCDRSRVEVPKSQLTFLEFFVKPTFEAVSVLVPKTAQCALQSIEAGRQHWQAAMTPQEDDVSP